MRIARHFGIKKAINVIGAPLRHDLRHRLRLCRFCHAAFTLHRGGSKSFKTDLKRIASRPKALAPISATVSDYSLNEGKLAVGETWSSGPPPTRFECWPAAVGGEGHVLRCRPEPCHTPFQLGRPLRACLENHG